MGRMLRPTGEEAERLLLRAIEERKPRQPPPLNSAVAFLDTLDNALVPVRASLQRGESLDLAGVREELLRRTSGIELSARAKAKLKPVLDLVQ